MTRETTQKCVIAPCTAKCSWKSKRLRTDVYKIFYALNFLNKEPCYGELCAHLFLRSIGPRKGPG